MSIGPFQILIIALIILVLFGRGRISEMMGDFGKGIKSFRKGLSDDDDTSTHPTSQIENRPAAGTADAKAPGRSNNPN